jgi:hypothetical protein
MADGNGNGHDTDISGAALGVGEYVPFTIGGREIRVPALSLWDLEQSREDIRSLDVGMYWTEYAATVLRIIARKLGNVDNYLPMSEAWMKSCTVKEANGITPAFNQLLALSGFENAAATDPLASEEAEASPGTGTSDESPPNSPSLSEFQTSDTSSEP